MEVKHKEANSFISGLMAEVEGGLVSQHGVKETEVKHSDKVREFLTGLEEDGEHISQYGVLGMKWGVRRSNRALKEARKRSSSSKSRTKEMSDDELKSRISRIEMEQKLNKLLTPPPSAGKTFVTNILKNSGNQLLTAALVGAGTYAMGQLGSKLAGNVAKPSFEGLSDKALEAQVKRLGNEVKLSKLLKS